MTESIETNNLDPEQIRMSTAVDIIRRFENSITAKSELASIGANVLVGKRIEHADINNQIQQYASSGRNRTGSRSLAQLIEDKKFVDSSIINAENRRQAAYDTIHENSKFSQFSFAHVILGLDVEIEETPKATVPFNLTFKNDQERQYFKLQYQLFRDEYDDFTLANQVKYNGKRRTKVLENKDYSDLILPPTFEEYSSYSENKLRDRPYTEVVTKCMDDITLALTYLGKINQRKWIDSQIESGIRVESKGKKEIPDEEKNIELMHSFVTNALKEAAVHFDYLVQEGLIDQSLKDQIEHEKDIYPYSNFDDLFVEVMREKFSRSGEEADAERKAYKRKLTNKIRKERLKNPIGQLSMF